MRFLKHFCAAALLFVASAARADFDLADNFRPLHFTATEGQTTFAGTWPIESDSQVKVYVSTDDGATWTLKTYESDYDVTGEGGSGFSVVFDTGLSADDLVILDRDSGVDRSTDLVTIEPTGVNTHFDRNTMHDQETEDIARRRSVQVGYYDDNNDGNGDPWARVQLPGLSDDVTGDPLCFLSKTNADLGFRATFCKGAGGGVCADCPTGTCSGGANNADSCASEEDCPGGSCVGFTTCDYIGVSGGVYTCNNGTCPDSCGGDGSGCLDCGDVGSCDGGDNDGKPCTDDDDCLGVCTGGACEGTGDACTTSAECSGTCDLTDNVCYGGSGDGDACTDDADCPEGGVCRPSLNVCWGGTNSGAFCTNDEDCPALCTGGFCDGGPDGGDVCASNGDCSSLCIDPDRDTCDGNCSINYCAQNTDCGDSCACDADNICLGGPNDGDGCTDDTDCAGTCTAGTCDTTGYDCAANADCGGVCAPEFVDEVCQGGTNDGDPCTDDADCPGGGTCDTSDGVGVRGPTPPVLDRSIAVWDGTQAAFIRGTDVKITAGDGIEGVSAITFSDATATPAKICFDGDNEGDPCDTDADCTGGQAGCIAPFIRWGGSLTNADGVALYRMPTKSPYYRVTTDGFDSDARMVWTSDPPSLVVGVTDMQWHAATYPITIYAPGTSTNADTIARIYFAEGVNCPDDFAGSEVWNGLQFTSSGTYNFQKNGSNIGTAVFDTDAAPNEAVLATTGGKTSFVAGDRLDIVAPATADATGGDLSFTLKCVKTFN